ncbi:fungal protein [Schizosaccharomyces japonicus yFS275]|uniref:Fungal protein n=1 Tax=Schizosaccharomyces japonicus (strain yFS275 / FY16936) TaxID=402676 RepID=B6K5A4_SCHJY|nr:fungal protein [Schizosaccharomyces japonicus yFS275]EEB08708.1 fungal protein [Schizosaccharomyces japonicus yFS275]
MNEKTLAQINKGRRAYELFKYIYSSKNANVLVLDFEAYERNQDLVTEAGVCLFRKKSWKTYHYRVRDYLHLKNGRFVADHSEHFKFGESIIIGRRQLCEVLTGYLRLPNLVVVAHGLRNELKYLGKLRIEIPPHVALVDTQDVYRFYSYTCLGVVHNQLIGLNKLLSSLSVIPFGLHNAGNDAHYTKDALLSMATALTSHEQALDADRCKTIKAQKKKSDSSTTPQSTKTAADDINNVSRAENCTTTA